MQKRNTIIIYHADCLDGFGGAWIAWKKFGNRARYIPMHPRMFSEIPKEIHNTNVYIIDNSLRRDDIEILRAHGNKIIIIDHHASSQSDVQYADEYRFDTNHSGSMLAWKYFFGTKKVPKLIIYIEDGDLWKFKYKETNEIRSVLRTYPMKFSSWNMYAKKLENIHTRKEIISTGKTLEKFRTALIHDALSHAYKVRFAGKTVYAINETNEAIRSEVAAILYTNNPPFSIVWSLERDEYHISLRSNGSYDVGALAKRYGGGGHTVAAGFSVSAHKPLPWKPVPQTKK